MDIDFSTNIWKKERNFLEVGSLLSSSTHVLVELVGQPDLAAKYATGGETSMLVDITDIVRMYNTGTFKVSELAGDTVVEDQTLDPWTVVGLINPATLVIPEHDLQARGALIIPPTRLLLPADNPSAVAECFFEEPSGWNVQGDGVFDSNKRRLTITGKCLLEDERRDRMISPQIADGCLPLVLVNWLSVTGVVKSHYFEVLKQSSEVTDRLELLEETNSYNVRKGQRYGMTLRLDGLDRYDLWYYSDLMTSSEVTIRVDGKPFAFSVDIVDSKVEIPSTDEGALGTLEVTLNYARYDTL